MTQRANLKISCPRLISVVASVALFASCPLVWAQAPVPPELVHGSKVDRKQTYNLGATGLRGWIHTQPLTTCILAGADHSTLYIAHGTKIYRRKLTVEKSK